MGVIRESELWACTTCNACVEACPVFINQVDYIVDFRRTLVAENRLDPMKRTFLENVGRANNPFGLPQQDRQSWLVEAGVADAEGEPPPRVPLLGGVPGELRPQGEEAHAGGREDPRRGEGQLRGARERGGVHGGAREEDGRRGALPGARAQEHREHRALRGEEGGRPLPALLQHLPQRVPRVRGEVPGDPPLPAHRRAGRAGEAQAREAARAR